MRVLVVAPYCNPSHTSEPLLAFNQCRALSRLLPRLQIATYDFNKAAIERDGSLWARIWYVPRHITQLKTLYRILPPFPGRSHVFRSLTHYYFEKSLWKLHRSEAEMRRFDVIHRITPVSSAIPSPLTAWSSTPMVIKPVNGGLPFPTAFRLAMHREKDFARYIRSAWNLFPYSRATYKNAAAVLAAFDHTISRLPRFARDRAINAPENGADPDRFKEARISELTPPFTFLFVGRLVPFKCADILIKALAESDILRRHRLVIVGDGPERSGLERMVSDHGLSGSVTFRGNLPQPRVAEEMSRAMAFVFPSIRDSGAGVVVEAMMAGLPVVAVGYGPVLDLLTEDTGIQIPLGHEQSHIAGFRSAMETLVADPKAGAAMGRRAAVRARALFDWDVRARKLVETYEWALGRRDRPPDFYQADI